MNDRLHLEVNFEEYITKKLAAQGTWVVSDNDEGFDPNTGLYIADFVAYLNDTAPKKVEKMQKSFKGNWASNLTMALVKSLEKYGTITTLREGFQMAGFQTITCSGHYPDDPRLPQLKDLYEKNILRVMRQVHYQTAGNKSLDLVFFINGIPVATAEVKTELTQTVQDAIEEYQTERKPVEPGTNRKNPLLMYKRGAVVHFAISEDEVWMCTNLATSKPRFLPFNKGTSDGHAGNDPMKPEDEDYPTSYFWNDICRKDNWLRIFHNFVFEEVSKQEDATGRMKDSFKQIFPRFHQWDSVTKCIEDVKTLGVGQRYLIEHSAGSGKTETITWLSHELIRLMQDNGERLFSSVIVVTDRKSLDTNIKATIKQLRKTVGLIAMIGGDDVHHKSGAKNKQLSEALIKRNEIIVVTIQTFPFALEAIKNDETLKNLNFAVLIDEAHSSQGGQVSAKMNAALKYANKKSGVKEEGDPTDEDLMNAFFLQQQESNQLPSNVSYFAFTATPKSETLTMFGRPGDKTDKNGLPIPESFHKYPMRQAIEEHYILDVLRGYMPYQTAYKLKSDIVPDTIVDQNKALRTIAHWQKLHPTNVMAKAEFIVEHFVRNVAKLLNGQAKAMVVTFSRASVVRYKYAIDAYIKAHPEYDKAKVSARLQFTVPGDPLVAFSGKVKGEDAIMPEDEKVIEEFEYLKENPFASIRRDYDYTEDNMNELGSESIEHAFDRSDNRIMIVADKFQTGFNQPKLCAMYIDKDIANDIEIVQTYSRLNRNYPGKDRVFIIDFRNDPKTVVNSFRKYDNGAEMEQAQDLSVIYDIKKVLDDAGIYSEAEFIAYKSEKYWSMVDSDEANKDSYRTKIYNLVSVPAGRWNDSMKNLQKDQKSWMDRKAIARSEADIKNIDARLNEIAEEILKLETFRKKLRKYVSAYEYISQVIDLGDPDLEVFCGFARLLGSRLDGTPVEMVDISSLVLTDLKVKKLDLPEEVGEGTGLRPLTAGGKGKTPKKESLKAIVEKINEIWGESVPTEVGARAINAIADYVASDDVSRIQIQNTSNTKGAVIADGRMENIIRLAATSLRENELGKLADKIITDPQTWKPIAEVIFDLVDKNKRIDMPELMRHLKETQNTSARPS